MVLIIALGVLSFSQHHIHVRCLPRGIFLVSMSIINVSLALKQLHLNVDHRVVLLGTFIL